jgi:hypothetical protein
VVIFSCLSAPARPTSEHYTVDSQAACLIHGHASLLPRERCHVTAARAIESDIGRSDDALHVARRYYSPVPRLSLISNTGQSVILTAVRHATNHITTITIASTKPMGKREACLSRSGTVCGRARQLLRLLRLLVLHPLTADRLFIAAA